MKRLKNVHSMDLRVYSDRYNTFKTEVGRRQNCFARVLVRESGHNKVSGSTRAETNKQTKKSQLVLATDSWRQIHNPTPVNLQPPSSLPQLSIKQFGFNLRSGPDPNTIAFTRRHGSYCIYYRHGHRSRGTTSGGQAWTQGSKIMGPTPIRLPIATQRNRNILIPRGGCIQCFQSLGYPVNGRRTAREGGKSRHLSKRGVASDGWGGWTERKRSQRMRKSGRGRAGSLHRSHPSSRQLVLTFISVLCVSIHGDGCTHSRKYRTQDVRTYTGGTRTFTFSTGTS